MKLGMKMFLAVTKPIDNYFKEDTKRNKPMKTVPPTHDSNKNK